MQMIRLILALLLLAPAALAAESAPHRTPRAVASLVSDTDAVAPGTPYHLGLRLQIAPGWHSYGRNPGDAGVAPELDWTLPKGTTVGDIAWPAPHREREGDVMTFAYTGDVLLAVPATGPGPVKLHASWLVCRNICVPEEADFSLDLPAGTPAPSAEAKLFAQAAASVPRPSPFPAEISPDGVLHVAGPDLATVRDAYFIPDQPDLIAPAAPQALRTGADGLTLSMTRGDAFKPQTALSGTLLLTDAGGQHSALSLVATPGVATPATPLWQAIGFALLGGLILNLMPCVFPVLAMKAFAIAKLAGARRGVVRAQAGAYTLGVVASFAAIGFGLIALRAAGSAAGWGFQFQSPLFVAGMAWVLFAVGLNLSGVFEIRLGVEGAGQSLTLRHGLAGSFASGVLAVLVATPCTAPFMGVAIAAALAAPPAATLAVFTAMGLGLAAPTLLLALIPACARALPRPGAWMEVLRQALAFPMYAAGVWLVWVLSQQAGPNGVLAVLAGCVLIGLAGWLLRLRGRIGRALAVLAVLGCVGLVPLLRTAPAQAEASADAYSPARLASLREAGKPVFLNMTASWCVTCLVNERVALGTKTVRDAFAADGITLLKGDWTRQDPGITAFLQSQGRDGVPLYVFYPPGHRPPVVLPQILTESEVLAAIRGS
jgi:thiol:disulfide interchange protein DsbD